MEPRILTDSDYELLRGEVDEELSDRALEQRQIRMRKRLRDAIVELGNLAEILEREDREKVFNPPPNAEASNGMMQIAAEQLMRFGYLGKKQSALYPTESAENAISAAENQYSIEKTGRENFADVEVTVTPNEQEKNVNMLADQFRDDPSSLSRQELTELMTVVSGAESAFPDITVSAIAGEIRSR